MQSECLKKASRKEHFYVLNYLNNLYHPFFSRTLLSGIFGGTFLENLKHHFKILEKDCRGELAEYMNMGSAMKEF